MSGYHCRIKLQKKQKEGNMKYQTVARIRADGSTEVFKLPSLISVYDIAEKFYHSEWCRKNGDNWEVYHRKTGEFCVLCPVNIAPKGPIDIIVFRALSQLDQLHAMKNLKEANI